MTDLAMVRLQRAQMLLQTDRINEAEKELRAALADMPEFAHAHGLLAICLSRRLKHEVALQEAKTAISLDPGQALFHYFYAECLVRAKRLDDARLVVERAISLDPYDADYYYMRAAIELEKNERNTARDTLMQALAIDPEHDDSFALLARVQAVLGETGDAVHLARRAVQNRPESSYAHISRGYSLLYAGLAKESFDAFREALRLDPNNESARSGLIEALKIHNVFYRCLFQMFATMSRLSAQYQWALIIGFIIGYNVLRGILNQMPVLAPVIVPLMILYLLFCFFTWVADPIIYSTLWFSRWGRMAMTLREKMVGIISVLLGTASVSCFVALFQTGQDFLFPLAFGFLYLLLPITRAVNSDHTEDIVLSTVISILVIALIFMSMIVHSQYFVLAIYAFIAYMFIANFLAIRRSAPQD